MKTSGIELKAFKKVKEDEKTATLKHPKGHQIVIAKKALSKPLRTQLDALPLHLAEGGDVSTSATDQTGSSDTGRDLTSQNQPVVNINVGQPQTQTPLEAYQANTSRPMISNPFTDNQPRINPNDVDYQKYLAQKQQTQETQPQPAPASMNQQPAPASSPAPARAQGGGGASGSVYDSIPGYKEQVAATNLQAGAESNQAKTQQGIYNNQFIEDQQSHDQLKRDLGAKMADIDAVTNDIRNGHIDPSHYLDSMGSSKKITTAIGLILGGMSAGTLGTVNPAMKFLDDQINRDVDAQKTNLGNKHNLLSALENQYGNRMAAENMFRAIRASTLSDQLGQAAAQSADPQARARALMAIGQLKQNVAPLVIKAHALQLAGNSGDPGQIPGASGQSGQPANGIDPASLVPYLVPKENQANVFKEIGQSQAAVKSEGDLMKVFDTVNSENSIAGRVGRLGFTPPSVKAYNALVDPLIHDNEGRINELEQAHVQALMPQPGDRPSSIKEKRDALQQFINHKKEAPTAKGYGLDLEKFASTASPASENSMEGKTASNAQGVRVIMHNGKWVPFNGR